VAVVSANVSALLPDDMLAGLHATRLGGASMTQLRGRIAELVADNTRLTQANTELTARFGMAEQNANALSRRVGALEASLPKMLEALATRETTDPTTTASIGDEGDAVTFAAEGGSVKVRRVPFLPSMADPAAGTAQPMPAVPSARTAPEPDPHAFGVALGAPIAAGQTAADWAAILDRVGPLLLGLGPLVGDQPQSRDRLVVGPLATVTQADRLCASIAKAGLSCTSVPFTGAPLPQ
jgi:hypothetical protein